MLKNRIIPKFLLKDGRLVKGVRFHENMREAGNPVSTAKIYNAYGVDEFMFFDIEASMGHQSKIEDIVSKISQEIFMPFTVGGGIETLEKIDSLLKVGADKVSINTAATKNPSFIKKAANRFGDQCIVVCIDYKEVTKGQYRVFSHGGCEITQHEPIEWAQRMQDCHCGEIVFCSIDRDGTMTGYDNDLLSKANEKIEVPIVASSGAGSLKDCFSVFETGVSAITISSMFLFTDHSPIKVRTYLSTNGVNVRSTRGSRS